MSELTLREQYGAILAKYLDRLNDEVPEDSWRKVVGEMLGEVRNLSAQYRTAAEYSAAWSRRAAALDAPATEAEVERVARVIAANRDDTAGQLALKILKALRAMGRE